MIEPGFRVFVQGGVGEPATIVAALNALAAETASTDAGGVDYIAVSIPGINQNLVPGNLAQGSHLTTFFMHPGIDRGDAGQSAKFLPLHYRDIYRYLQREGRFDLGIIQVSPPDDAGLCSLGVSVDFVPAILDKCDRIIAEVNERMPRPPGSPTLHVSQLDFMVRADYPLPEKGRTNAGKIELAVARNVAALIEDDSCIQIGIGKLPGGILNELSNHRRLGLHTGLVSDEVGELIDRGVITGESKNIDRGEHVVGMAWGEPAFYEWLNSQDKVIFRPVDYTHDISVISSLDRFVSINSVLEVDLYGQANAETVNGRQVSATGGLVDFVRGARASKGGLSILALPATALQGQASRVVAALSGGIATVSRADIDHVVTEHGSTSLFAKSIEARAKALVDIAAPEFRDQLWTEWEWTRSPERKTRKNSDNNL
jgi:4-hydroxybutyrate CoA-transferase